MKNLIVANWKCNPTTLKEAKRLFNSVKRGVKNIKNTEVVICPPFPYLSIINNYSLVKLGAQDVFWEEKGAFTGEVSPPMLKDLGCQYVIIGHSERRRILDETDEIINKKLKAVIAVALKPILCIGETENERKKGKTFEVLKRQLKCDLESILNLKSKIHAPYRNKVSGAGLNLVVAYEPIWAIGTGNPCLPPEAKKVYLFLRKFLKKNPILYGGSVNSENALNYIKTAGFNGLLVGGASLNAKEFVKIVKDIDLFS